MTVKILVVDDDSYIRSFLHKRLSARGYEVLLAENGEMGFQIAQQERPHLIISDLMMPIMDGMQLCERIKKDDNLKYTYIILLTARDTAEDKIEGMERGADDFMTKPFNERELFARIQVGLRIIALQQELAQYQHSKAISELAVTISHEINNPLGIIMLTLQVMRKKIGTEREKELFSDIETALANGHRISDIVKRLCAIGDLQFKPYLKNSDIKMLDLTGKP